MHITVDMWNPRRAYQIIGNYRRDAVRSTTRKPWRWGTWRRIRSLQAETIWQSNIKTSNVRDVYPKLSLGTNLPYGN